MKLLDAQEIDLEIDKLIKSKEEYPKKIEKLKTEENIADENTMAAIKRLIDYHDQVKSTPNTALNIQASLNFLNSLLLPLLSSILGNLDKAIEILK